MQITIYKLSDVTKALKKAGFNAISADEALTGVTPRYSFFKYKGGLHISGGKIGFTINNKADARIFGAYATDATNESGESCEVLTDVPQFFFPRLFGYLAGEISENDIIAEICN